MRATPKRQRRTAMTSARLHSLGRYEDGLSRAHPRSTVRRSRPVPKTYVVSIPVVIVSAISLVMMPSDLPQRTTAHQHRVTGGQQQ